MLAQSGSFGSELRASAQTFSSEPQLSPGAASAQRHHHRNANTTDLLCAHKRSLGTQEISCVHRRDLLCAHKRSEWAAAGWAGGGVGQARFSHAPFGAQNETHNQAQVLDTKSYLVQKSCLERQKTSKINCNHSLPHLSNICHPQTLSGTFLITNICTNANQKCGAKIAPGDRQMRQRRNKVLKRGWAFRREWLRENCPIRWGPWGDCWCSQGLGKTKIASRA